VRHLALGEPDKLGDGATEGVGRGIEAGNSGGGVSGGEEAEAGAKKVVDGEAESVGAGPESEGERDGARIGEFGGGVDLEGGGEEVEEEGSGEEEEGEEEEKAFSGVGFVGIWICVSGRRRRRRSVEGDHARVQLGTVGWNVGRRRGRGRGRIGRRRSRAFLETHWWWLPGESGGALEWDCAVWCWERTAMQW